MLYEVITVFIGMTKPETVYHEALANFEVILLLIFMVAGIYFMKDFLRFTFTRILVKVQSKYIISLLFCFAGAFLSAFLVITSYSIHYTKLYETRNIP